MFSASHEHDSQKHDDRASDKQPIHQDWRVWVVVLVMLAAMGIYVATNDESVAPGVAPAPQVPAAR